MKSNDYKKVGNANWYTDDKTFRSETNSYLDSVYSENPSNGKKKSKPHKKKKCDHKHEWQEVILETKYRNPLTGKTEQNLHLGKRCTICEEIRETRWFITEVIDGHVKTLDYKEIKKKYFDLPIINYLG